MITTLRELRKIPHFYQLFFARTVSNFGNGISPVALAFGVLGIEGADAGSLSLVMVSRTLPVLLLLLVGGTFADKYGRARTMGWADMLLGFLILIVAASFIANSPSVLLLVIVGFMSGVLNGIWYPAFSGLTPIIVPSEKLQSANSAIGFGSNIAFMLGTASGGLVVSALGTGWALGIDALTFIVAGAMILPLAKLPQTGQAEAGEKVNFIHELKTGWKEFSSRSWLVVIVVGFSFVNLSFEATWAVLGALQSIDAYDGASSWGLILGFMSVGFLLGTLIANKVRPRRPLRFIMLIMLADPVFLLLFGLGAPLLVLLLSAVLMGIALDVFYVLWMTTIQQNVPEESLSRVNSYDTFGSYLFGPLGVAIAGPVAMQIGAGSALIIGSVISITALLIAFSFPSVRNLRAIETN
jgi:MFS family permease